MTEKWVLEKVPRKNVPAGSKVYTANQVFEHYITIISEWKTESDVWAFKYGWMGLGVASCTANFLILRQYRQRLKLTHSIMAFLTLGCAVAPSIIAPIGHAYLITKKIFLEDDCLACLHIRGVAVQLFSSLGYALTINPALCFMKAQHLCTYNVPGYYTAEQRLKTWTLYKKFTRRAFRTIYTQAVLNSVVASIVTASQIKQFTLLKEKLLVKNKEVEELKKTLSQ